MLERGRLPLRLHFYGAIVTIPDVALNPELAGVPLGEESKADALDIAKDLRFEAPTFFLCGQSGVRDGTGGDHHGDPFGRIGDRLERAAYDR